MKIILGSILLALTLFSVKSFAEDPVIYDLSKMELKWAAQNGVVGICFVHDMQSEDGFCNYFSTDELIYCEEISRDAKNCRPVVNLHKETDI